MLLFDSLTTDLIAVFATTLLLIITYFKWSFKYWERLKVPHFTPTIPFGNLSGALTGKEQFAVALKHLYNQMKLNNWKFGGIYMFNRPIFFPIDLDLIRNITTKDFHYFVDRDLYVNENEPLQAHLPNLKGSKWKNMRAKLTPVFTSGKIKAMFQVMNECQRDLIKRMDAEVLTNQPIDIKEILACFTTNIIGSCAFGLDCNALEKEDSEFRAFGRKMFATTKLETILRIFAMTFPSLATFLNIRSTKKEIADFINSVVGNTIKYREENNYSRNDFMQLMINLKNNAPTNSGDHDGKPLTFDEVASQCIVFFAAGFETSSTLMTFALYELARNQEIQDRLRDEIETVLEKHDRKITYDSIQDMKYLNQVIDEALRKHPPAGLFNRKCVKNYKISGTDVIIKKGTTVMISVLGIHHDSEFYPNPYKFDPERFSEENKTKRHNFAFLPFGEGPRNCIGMRFGLLQAKMGLVTLLKNYRFTLNSKTIEPIAYRQNSMILTAKGDIWLNAQKI